MSHQSSIFLVTNIPKSQIIHNVAFLDSYKSPMLLIFIDNIEHIIECVLIGYPSDMFDIVEEGSSQPRSSLIGDGHYELLSHLV
jgi:hypothetical protein